MQHDLCSVGDAYPNFEFRIQLTIAYFAGPVLHVVGFGSMVSVRYFLRICACKLSLSKCG